MTIERLTMDQGSPEWISLRKTKITATDASVIMGQNPWKTLYQLIKEKQSSAVSATYCNDRMRRGIELEPVARMSYIITTGMHIEPAIYVNDWTMASLDGINDDETHIVEIKCPGEADHALACSGQIPEHYYSQLQHQMYVCDVQNMSYYSFDGNDGVIVKVERDDEYIGRMIKEERKFYESIILGWVK